MPYPSGFMIASMLVLNLNFAMAESLGESTPHIDISQVPLDEALVEGDANAPNKVIVFTDPDCPHCARLDREVHTILKSRKDIVFYIKLYPVRAHPQAYEKSRAIVCGKSIALLDDGFAGRNIPAPRCNSTEVDSNLKLGERLGITGVPETILPDGSVVLGYKGADNLLSLIDTAAQMVLVEPQEATFRDIAVQYRAANPKPELSEDARRLCVQADFAVQQKRFSEAARLYGEALKLAPWWPPGHYNRALILAELKYYATAITEMRRYLQLAPGASNARAVQDKIYQWESLAPK